MTRGQEMIAAIDAARDTLRKLAFGPHARHSISAVIDPLGSRLETFLRTAALPLASRRQRLVDFIKDLATHGVDQATRDDLDALRDLYNDSKHKPQVPLLLGPVTDIVEKAALAIQTICALNVGVTGSPLGRELNYSLWVGFWDYYTGGMTEAAIMLPGDHWTHVSTVDTFQMDIKNWDAFKPILQAHTRFRLGKEHFQPEVWTSMSEEGGFLNAGVWDGDYSEIVRILAPFHDTQIESSVIAGTRRIDSAISVGAAVIMAAVDIARAASQLPDEPDLRRAIAQRAADEYAITPQNPAVEGCIAQVAAGLLTLPFATWRVAAGPVLAGQTSANGTTIDGPLRLSIDQNAFVLKSF
jgi:hypothetical protein